jgi:hypothetical protein
VHQRYSQVKSLVEICVDGKPLKWGNRLKSSQIFQLGLNGETGKKSKVDTAILNVNQTGYEYM